MRLLGERDNSKTPSIVTEFCRGIVIMMRKSAYWHKFMGAMLVGLALFGMQSGWSQESINCAASGPASGDYEINVCLTHNATDGNATGAVIVTGTLEVSGSSPGVRTVVFYLDDKYLLTDYEAPYTFELPTTHFVDGPHRLAVAVLLQDGLVSNQAVAALNFSNGITTTPVNTNTFTPSSGRPAQPGEPFIVAVVGDGAGGKSDALPVVDLIASWNPNLFLYLGDVYDNGSYSEFYNWYGDETHLFGRFRAITNPITGDHEYRGREAPGYYDYWDNIPDYYSFDVAGWHFISLNSTTQFGQRMPGSPQYEWLLQDLNKSASQCTIAYLHQPIFSIGQHGGDDGLMDIWALLAQHGVEMTFSGNDHDYERWQPLDAAGQPDPSGTIPFVVGTGGQSIREFAGSDPHLAKGYDATSAVPVFGALKLELNPRGLEYRFINVEGKMLDSGVIGCEGAEADTTPPTPPSSLTSALAPSGEVMLNWTEAKDDTGVAGYTLYRDGVVLATLDGPTPSYIDTSARLGTTYTYNLQAFDLANNGSVSSESVTATTSSTVTLTLTPVADAYVDESAPADNYGGSSKLRVDSTPVVQSHMRFNVPPLAGNVLSATLSVYANGASSAGHDVYAVSQNEWNESDITYTTAPQPERLIGSSGAFQGDIWVSIDVTSLISGEGPLSLALLTTGTTNITYSSREGAKPPQLSIEVGGDAASR
jgi:Calcineurin-like phosphoesterase